jgi:hypothetical protein
MNNRRCAADSTGAQGSNVATTPQEDNNTKTENDFTDENDYFPDDKSY